MTRFRRFCLATAAVALASGALASGALAADTQTADQLQSDLRNSLRQWGNPLADRLTVKPEGDGYAVRFPLMNWRDASGNEPAMATATAKPLDNGTWSIDQFVLPSPATLTGPGAGGETEDKAALSIKDQTSRWTFDPKLGFATAASVLLQGLTFHDVRPDAPDQRIGSLSIEGGTTPTTPDHGTIDATGELKELAFNGKDDHGVQTDVGIARLRVAVHLTDVARDRFAQFIGAFRQLTNVPKPAAGAPPAPPSPEARAAMRAMVDALNGLADDGHVDYSIDGLTATGTQPFGVDHIGLGISATAPDGVLKLAFDFGVDGITVPNLPDTMKVYIPSHIQLRPYLTGVSASDVTRIATLALGDEGPQAASGPAMQAVFAHGGLKVGLETIAIDIGPAKMTGTGEITATQPGPSGIAGEAKITASGVDDLLKQIQADPQGAQAVPLLVFARGLGKPQPDGSLFWDVVYKPPGLTVNGVSMMPTAAPPGGAPGGAVPPKVAPAPGPAHQGGPKAP